MTLPNFNPKWISQGDTMRIKNFFSIVAFVGGIFFMNSLYADNSQQAGNNAGQAFLSKNMTAPGVVTLPDGLQYKIIKQGQGPSPAISDTVTVNYAGKLINGTEFDSSYKRGEPAKFKLSEVIPGWTEALQRMNKGSIWEIYVPASLAYGERGMPPVIGPNETLIFKVELLDINK